MASERFPAFQSIIMVGMVVGLNGCLAPSTGVSQKSSPRVATEQFAFTRGEFDADALAAKLRALSVSETTLPAFCKNPPKPTTPIGIRSLKTYCARNFLARASNAKVFELTEGSYQIAFREPLKPSEFCRPDAPNNLVCKATGMMPGEKIVSAGFSVE